MQYCTCHRRKNPDDSLREAERRARATGDPNDVALWVSERLRAGEIDPKDFEATVGAGHPIAGIVVGNNTIPIKVTAQLIHVSDPETMRLSLINTLERLLASKNFSLGFISNDYPRLAAEATIRGLQREPYHVHILSQLLQHLPRTGRDTHLNFLTYALNILWDVDPLHAIDAGPPDSLEDVFEFLGQAHPEGRMASVIELGNTLLGIPGGLPN